MSECDATNAISAAALGDRLKLLKILLKHADQLPAIGEHLEAIGSAPTITGKWDEVKAAGDILVPIGEELRAAHGMLAVGTLAGLESQAVALGINWPALLLLVPKIEAALRLMLQLVDMFQPVE